MPIYAYICRNCGASLDSTTRNLNQSCACGNVYTRDFRFNRASSFIPHFNHSVGKYVRNQSEFNSELRRASDRASATTGAEHNYVPVDAAEVAKTSSGEGLEETARRRRQLGIDQATKKIIT